MTRSTVRGLFAALCMLTVFTAYGLDARAAEHMSMMDMIGSAKTAADHEAIASQYDRDAAAAKAKAEEHRKMAAEYRKMGGPAVKAQLPEHCEGLAVQFEGEAKEFAAMAQAHRDLAKAAK